MKYRCIALKTADKKSHELRFVAIFALYRHRRIYALLFVVLRVLLWDECDISQMYKNPHNTYTGCQLILTCLGLTYYMFMLPMHWSVKMLDIIACILQKDHSEMQSCSKVLPRIFYEISWWSHHYTVPTYICIVCDKVCITFIWRWYNRMYMQMCYFDSATSTCVKMFMSSLWTLFGGGNQVLELF